MFHSRVRCLFNITGRRSGSEISGFAGSVFNEIVIDFDHEDPSVSGSGMQLFPMDGYPDCSETGPLRCSRAFSADESAVVSALPPISDPSRPGMDLLLTPA